LNDKFEKVNFEKINIKDFPELEQYMLHKIYNLNCVFEKNFEKYNFHTIYKEIINFCTSDLSAFYFDIRKDVLYCDPLESKKRISTIKFLNIVLEILLKWFAPVLSFTTEEIYSLLKIEEKESIHLEKFPVVPSNWNNQDLNNKWIELIKIRDKCNSSIELKRASKEIGSSLEANLKIFLNDKLFKLFKNADFSELCITSGAEIDKINKDNTEEIVIETNKAEGKKCSVCWKINKDNCDRHGHLQ